MQLTLGKEEIRTSMFRRQTIKPNQKVKGDKSGSRYILNGSIERSSERLKLSVC